ASRTRARGAPHETKSLWLVGHQWATASMLESPAWRAMPGHAIKVVMRIALEHLKHGGVENGGLPTTYNDFVSCGVRRARIREAIMIAIYLGWIERVSIGETPWHGDI